MDKTDYFLGGFGAGVMLSIILTGIIFLFINKSSYERRQNEGYKQGQIDCLNGIQNYDKVATKDSVYIKIK